MQEFRQSDQDCSAEFTLEQLLAFFSGPGSFADLSVQVGAPKENHKETLTVLLNLRLDQSIDLCVLFTLFLQVSYSK